MYKIYGMCNVGTMWDLLRKNDQCRSETSCMSSVRSSVLSSLYYIISKCTFFENAVFSRKVNSVRYAKFLLRNRISENFSFQICA